jgi:uncharacterized membrane protein
VFFNPLTFLFMILSFFFLAFFFVVIQIDLVAAVFEKIGIPPHYVLAALLASLIGGSINIPLRRIPQEDMTTDRAVRFFGLTYTVPASRNRETILAVNVGGAIVPVLISVYLLTKTGLFFKAFLATAILAFIAHRAARPIKGVGIALPFFLSPLVAAFLALMIAPAQAPVVAYISGTLGTLIGADLLNLKRIQNLGAPVASIGGAGTFDGIFLSGILAVLLSTVLR